MIKSSKILGFLHTTQLKTCSECWNKSTIATEIVEGLEKIPVVKENQSKKVIDLIRTVEKALADLTELGDNGPTL